nr:hypothetical protein [Tanacetum cinerariifolium]
EDEYVLSAEEQPLPPVVSPTAESPGYVEKSDPEEDLEEYEDDESEDGPVDYLMDGGDDRDDDDGDPSGDDADDEDDDEEKEEHLASASISLPPKAEVERLLAMPTAVLPSLPLPPPLYIPPLVDRLSQAVHYELQTHHEQVYTHECQIQAHQTQLQPQGTLIQTHHQVHETRFQMQQAKMTELRETDRRRQAQMVEILRVMRDMIREMGDMQAELFAPREHQRRARQPGSDSRVPNHQDASRDADSHI